MTRQNPEHFPAGEELAPDLPTGLRECLAASSDLEDALRANGDSGEPQVPVIVLARAEMAAWRLFQIAVDEHGATVNKLVAKAHETGEATDRSAALAGLCKHLEYRIQEKQITEQRMQHFVDYMRLLGGKWQDIADTLGVSKQTAHYNFASSNKARRNKFS